jgi:O-antigen/teichoic acid export membrane protein
MREEGAASRKHNDHLKRRVLKGTFWFMSGTAARAILRLIVMAVLARLLMPADFGLVGAASIFVAFAELFSISGIVLSIVQLREIQSRHVHTAFTTSALTGITAGGIMWLMSGPIAHLLNMPKLEPILEVLALLFPLNALSAVSQKLLERELAYGKRSPSHWGGSVYGRWCMRSSRPLSCGSCSCSVASRMPFGFPSTAALIST